eukprot:g2606.t1
MSTVVREARAALGSPEILRRFRSGSAPRRVQLEPLEAESPRRGVKGHGPRPPRAPRGLANRKAELQNLLAESRQQAQELSQALASLEVRGAQERDSLSQSKAAWLVHLGPVRCHRSSKALGCGPWQEMRAAALGALDSSKS